MEMEPDTVVLQEDFESPDIRWTTRTGAGSGVWNAGGGMLTFRRESLGIKSHTPSRIVAAADPLGTLTSFSAEVRLRTQEVSAGFLFAWGYRGSYLVRLVRTGPADSLKCHVELCRSGFHNAAKYAIRAAGKSFDTYGLSAGPDEWHRIVIRRGRTALHVCVDGVEMASYDDSRDDGAAMDTGTVGFFMGAGEADFRRVSVRGSKSRVAAPDAPQEPEDGAGQTHYQNDFENEPVGHVPKYWIQRPGDESWTVRQMGEKRVYASRLGECSACTWLHILARDGSLETVFSVGAHRPDARAGLFARAFVEGGLIRAGYDFCLKKWFISSSLGPDFATRWWCTGPSYELTEGEDVRVRLTMEKGGAALYLNGQRVLSAQGIDNRAFGRMGIFSEGAELGVRQADFTLKGRHEIPDGLLEYDMIPDVYANYLELVQIDHADVLAVSEQRRFISHDEGRTFLPAGAEYAGVNAGGGYSSILRLRGGSFIQTLSGRGFRVQASRDLKNWRDIGRVLPAAEQFTSGGLPVTLQHVSSLTEVDLPSGGTRIFLPVCFREYDGNVIAGHYTRVFYSDDGGKSWHESANDTRDVQPGYAPHSFFSWSESKIVRCADGTLRMYCSRIAEDTLCYTVSYDGGVTWSGFYRMADMPCAVSSFGVCEDPCRWGTYYLAYVSGHPYFMGSLFPRQRLLLMRSRNGQDWEQVMEVDRLFPCGNAVSYEIYQFLDPSVLATEKFLYIGYGKSVRSSEMYHNAQRARYVRLPRSPANAV